VRAPGDSEAAGLNEGMRAPYAIRAFTRIAKPALEQESEFANLDFDLDLDVVLDVDLDDGVQCNWL